MKKFYWFGDTWLTGSELELVVPNDTSDQYPRYKYGRLE